MTHRCTAVVYDPTKTAKHGPSCLETYEFEVGSWYEAMDQLCHEIEDRHRPLQRIGLDDLEIRAFSMINLDRT